MEKLEKHHRMKWDQAWLNWHYLTMKQWIRLDNGHSRLYVDESVHTSSSSQNCLQEVDEYRVCHEFFDAI
jgi:hypothetical protein